MLGDTKCYLNKKLCYPNNPDLEECFIVQTWTQSWLIFPDMQVLSWNRSWVIMKHLQIISFSTTEMEASFFILFRLVERWSLMPEIYIYIGIYLFCWLSIEDKKEPSRNRISWAHCVLSLWWNADFPLKGKSFFWKS